MRPIRIASLLLVLSSSAALVACGSSDDDVDAATYDARLGADSSEVLPDAAAETACDVGGNPINCATASQICVITNNSLAECEQADFDGCLDGPRNCGSLCGGLFCDDGPEDNIILCSE